jgi:8-oxo-dGTP pyrophosphatase MutT (NUDIX family)
VREVREETGLDVEVVGFLGIWIDDYGVGSPEWPADVTLNCYYHVRALDDRSPHVDPRELSEAAWFAPDDLPGRIAFPDHAAQVLAAWRDALASPGTSIT